MKNENIYFLSDIHLGLPDYSKSLVREKLLVKFLDEIKTTAKAIYFVGDIFDFWWEYKSVVPKGFVRFFGKLAELSDSGIKIHFFTGNHDIWLKNYLSEELGITIHHKELKLDLGNKKVFVAHGDGLGPGDSGYKFLKALFTNKFLQWWFTRLHPNFAFFIARNWSQGRRKKEKYSDFKGYDKELLILFANETLKTEKIDYFIFGHRHFPMKIPLNNNSELINLGDWIVNFTYAVFDGENLNLKTYKKSKIENFETRLDAKYKLDIFD